MRAQGMLYLDCFSGRAGDMMLGALIDLGLPIEALQSALGSLAIDYGGVAADRVLRAGVSATKFRLIDANRRCEPSPPAHDPGTRTHQHHHPHHHLSHIVAAIRRSALSAEGQERAVASVRAACRRPKPRSTTRRSSASIFTRSAPSTRSSTSSERCTRFEWFGIDDIVASPLNVGGGTVTCAHGTFPVPAPATVRLLSGVPVYGNGTTELVTPTGALLVTGYARSSGRCRR